MAVPTTRRIPDQDPSSHVLAVPVSDEELWEMSSEFIAGGLAAGEQVSYFDDGTADSVLERMADDGVSTDEPMRVGQLQVVPAEFTRQALLAPLDELGGLLEQNIQGALDAGWAGLRFTGTMTHGLQRPGGVVLPEYDTILEQAVRGHPAHALCFYDEPRYPPELIDRMRELHRTEVVNPTIYDDAQLRITHGSGAAVRLAGEIDNSNRQQLRRVLDPLLERALRSDDGPRDVVLDVTSLRFCDVAAAVAVVHAAEEFPAAHRLVLAGVRPRLRRTLERCGALAAPQLVLRSR